MILKDIILEWLRENLLLFKRPDEYRSVIAVRSIALVVILAVTTAVVLVFQGKIQFDISFVLSIFAIFISWLFFSSAERNSTKQMRQLQDFLKEFRSESQHRFEALHERFDSIFKTGTPPSPPDEGGGSSAADTFATALSEVMKAGPKQMVIALSQLRSPIRNDSMPIEYTYELEDNISKSNTMLSYLARELAEVKMVSFDPSTGEISLSDRGRKFAKWLSDHGQKASYFECPMLGFKWGTPSERFIAVKEKWKQQEEERKRSNN